MFLLPCYTRAISERFRDNELIYKALYKFICLLLFLLAVQVSWSEDHLAILYIHQLNRVDSQSLCHDDSTRSTVLNISVITIYHL